MGHSIAVFKGARNRRDARRDSRRDARKLRNNGPAKQSYGGSSEETQRLRDQATKGVSDSQDQYKSSADKLGAAGDLATRRESSANSEHTADRVNTSLSRGQFNASIDNMGTARDTAVGMRNTAATAAIGTRNAATTNAIGMRNQALQANDLNKIAQQNILENNQNSQNILGRNIGIQNRAAMGLATGGGEGGALALQNAIAGASQGGADMAGAAQLQQNQLATDTRNAAAQQQVANALNIAGVNAGTVTDTSNLNAGTITGTGDANAGTTTDAATNIAAQTAALRNADQATTDAASARQLNFLGQKNALAGGTSDAALTNQGQQIGYQQGIDTTQLGVDQANEAARLASNKRNSLLGKINIVTQGTTGGLLGK